MQTVEVQKVQVKSLYKSEELLSCLEAGDVAGSLKCLAKGANVNAMSYTGKTALHVLALNYSKFVPPAETEEKKRELRKSFLSLVQALLESGANPNLLFESRTPALMFAYQGVLNDEGGLETLKLLQQHGADLGALDGDGRGIFFWAAVHINKGLKPAHVLFNRLVEIGVHSPDPDQWTSDIFALTKRGALTQDLLSALAELKGPDIFKIRDGEGQNLLMAYCFNQGVRSKLGAKDSVPGSIRPEDVIDYMLLNGADINNRSNRGNTILTRATWAPVSSGYLRFFIARGADMYYAPNGWDTYIVRSLMNNYSRNTWDILQDFVDFSGDIKAGLPILTKGGGYPHPGTMLMGNNQLDKGIKIALFMLLLAISYPEEDRFFLSQATGKNRAMGIRGIGAILEQGGRLSPLLVKSLFNVINSIPPVKGSLSRAKENEVAGLFKLIILGAEHCGPETVEFIQKHVGKRTLEKWMALKGVSEDALLMSGLATLLRNTAAGRKKTLPGDGDTQISF